jgi:hypothetical protein
MNGEGKVSGRCGFLGREIQRLVCFGGRGGFLSAVEDKVEYSSWLWVKCDEWDEGGRRAMGEKVPRLNRHS